MQVIDKLSEYIKTENLFGMQDQVLLAVSGGKDSMLMAYLLSTMGYKLSIAHCNFQLRGQESDLDEELVKSFAAERGIPCFVQRMDTVAYAKAKQLSIQMSARELRYNWFHELCEAQHIDAVAIAHHQQDHIETVLVNLTRGTGLAGLKGIAAKRGQIVRPLLWMSAKELKEAVEYYQIPYRDDQSNFSNKYIRNKIRLDILPQFRELNPAFDQVMLDNIVRFEETFDLLQRLTHDIRSRLFVSKPNRDEMETVEIDKAALLPYLNDLPLLYQLFRPYQFEKNILADLAQSGMHHIGSRFESSTHILSVDRDKLLLHAKGQQAIAEQYIFKDASHIHIGNFSLELVIQSSEPVTQGSESLVDQFAVKANKDQGTAYLDADKLIFPLTVRSWRKGDRFVPLGMNTSKKVSDFFIQQKIPRLQKEQIPLLINGNGELIWVVGHRMDNRYKITENTKKVATFVYR